MDQTHVRGGYDLNGSFGSIAVPWQIHLHRMTCLILEPPSIKSGELLAHPIDKHLDLRGQV
jgi:hypothetical protein